MLGTAGRHPASCPAARRDDYDREMKQAKEKVKKRHTPTPPRPRKPDQQVYHPRRRSEPGAWAGGQGQQQGQGLQVKA